MQKSICAGFNKFSAAIYLPPCFPEAFFIFQFQVQLNFFPRLLNGCCCPILNPFFPPNVPTGCCAWNQLSPTLYKLQVPAVHCNCSPLPSMLPILLLNVASVINKCCLNKTVASNISKSRLNWTAASNINKSRLKY